MPESVHVVRQGLSRLYLCEGTNEQNAIDALESEGEVLKRTPKTITKRVGDWVVKSSRYNFGLGPLARTTLRARYRRGWQASLRLRQRGVDAPAPRAFIERGACGVIAGNTLITDYLHGYLGIEEWLTSNPAWRGGEAVMDRFLESLADALKDGSIAGAGHDTFVNEPLSSDSSLRELPNAIFSPHTAGTTTEALTASLEMVVDNTLGFLAGNPQNNVI